MVDYGRKWYPFCIRLFGGLKCLYAFTVKASSVCNDIWDILEGTNQRSCVVSIIQVLLLSSFISLSKNVIFHHVQRRNSRSRLTGEKTV